MRKFHALYEDVQNAVAKLLLPRRPYTKQPGDGHARAVERLSARRAEQTGIDLTPSPSRQQTRAHERWKSKRALSLRKAEAMRAKQPGGSAAIR